MYTRYKIFIKINEKVIFDTNLNIISILFYYYKIFRYKELETTLL